MAVTETDRRRLYETLKSSLGPQDAETFMNLITPANWTEFAMKSDIAELRSEVKDDIGELQRTLGTWLFASQAAVIAAIGVVGAVTIAVLN